jgi:uncharacterized protein YprB with RNaseH-like and TPR domain
MPTPVFDAISREWRTRIDNSHDFSVIRNDTIFRTSFSDSYVLESEYRQVEAELSRLAGMYEGYGVEDVFHGAVEETAEGPCFVIRTRENYTVPHPARQEVKQRFTSDLTMVRGIGRKTMEAMTRKGCRSIEHLTGHRRFGQEARACLRTIRGGEIDEIISLVRRWYPASHPFALLTAALFDKSDLVFIDLETLGFFSRPIILVGIAVPDNGMLSIYQYLLRDMSEELASLLAMRAHLEGRSVIVSFNGKAFDIPYLRERFAFYGEPSRIENHHYDVLHPARRRWKHEVPDCRLQTLESHLFGIRREKDIPSAMVPEFYEAYLCSGNPGPLVPIVEHNRQDLVTLARIYGRLIEEECHECS